MRVYVFLCACVRRHAHCVGMCVWIWIRPHHSSSRHTHTYTHTHTHAYTYTHTYRSDGPKNQLTHNIFHNYLPVPMGILPTSTLPGPGPGGSPQLGSLVGPIGSAGSGSGSQLSTHSSSYDRARAARTTKQTSHRNAPGKRTRTEGGRGVERVVLGRVQDEDDFLRAAGSFAGYNS